MPRISPTCIALLGSALLWGSAQALDVRTAAQDSQPKFIKEGAGMQGLCVDIFKAIERVAPELKFVDYADFTPLARIEAQLEEGALDAFCGLAKTDKRQQMFDILEPPLYTTHTVLAARSDEKADPKGFDEIAKLGDDAVVLAVTKTVHADTLAAQPKVRADTGGKDTSANLKKLVEGRGRFVLHNDFALADEIKRDKLDGKVKLLSHQFATEGRYLVLSKKAKPEIKAKLTAALDKLAKSGELAKIFQAYKPK